MQKAWTEFCHIISDTSLRHKKEEEQRMLISFRKLYCSISRRVTGINNIQQSTLIGKKTFSTHCSSSHIDEERGSLLWQFYRLMFRLWWICHTPGFCIFLPEQDLPVLANTDCTLHVVLRFVVCCGLVHS